MKSIARWFRLQDVNHYLCLMLQSFIRVASSFLLESHHSFYCLDSWSLWRRCLTTLGSIERGLPAVVGNCGCVCICTAAIAWALCASAIRNSSWTRISQVALFDVPTDHRELARADLDSSGGASSDLQPAVALCPHARFSTDVMLSVPIWTKSLGTVYLYIFVSVQFPECF